MGWRMKNFIILEVHGKIRVHTMSELVSVKALRFQLVCQKWEKPYTIFYENSAYWVILDMLLIFLKSALYHAYNMFETIESIVTFMT